MNKATLDAAKQIIFQGETDGVQLPRELMFSLELYESLRRRAMGRSLTPEDVSLFVTLAVVHHTPTKSELELVGTQFFVPSRNETVTVDRPAAWGCLVVRGKNNEPMVMHRSRLEEIPETTEAASEPEQPQANDKSTATVGRKRLVTV